MPDLIQLEWNFVLYYQKNIILTGRVLVGLRAPELWMRSTTVSWDCLGNVTLAVDTLMRKFWKFIWLRGNVPHPVEKLRLIDLMSAFKSVTKYLLKPEGKNVLSQLHPFFSSPHVKAYPWEKAHGEQRFPQCEVTARFTLIYLVSQ